MIPGTPAEPRSAAPAAPIPAAEVTQKTDLAISSLGVFFIVQLLNCATCKQSAGACLGQPLNKGIQHLCG